jgi:hypothetical protein
MGLFSRKPQPQTSAADSIASTPQPAAPAEAPPESAPQEMVSHTLVQTALAAWAQNKNAASMFNVLRHCASGSLLLDISSSTFADPARGFTPGDTVAIGYQVDNAGKRVLLAFTDNARLSAYLQGKTPISLVQPASAVLKQAMTDYDGIVIDPGSPDSCIAYSAEIAQGMTEDPSVNEPLKSAVVARSAVPEVLQLAASAPVIFIGTVESRDEAGEIISISVPQVTGGDGVRYASGFTSPAEVWAWDTTLNARPTGFANIAATAIEYGLQGVVINPAGPSVVIPVEELGEFERPQQPA